MLQALDKVQIRKECWNQAVRSYATGYIFERRANLLRFRLQVLTFLGLVVPLLIGSIVLTFGLQLSVLPVFIYLAGGVGVIQLAISLWSLTARWDDKRDYANKSNSFNKNMALRYRQLASNPPRDDSALDLQFQFLEVDYQRQSAEDEIQGVSDKEKRRGLRAALREFKRPCVTCEQVPTSMKPSQCDTCGNF